MKKILILGAGGPAGVLLTRCLSDFDVYGADDSKWAKKLVEAKTDYNIDKIDLIIPTPDVLVKEYAGCPKCFLPDEHDIEVCQDKSRLAKRLGNLAPKTNWVRDTHGAGGRGAKMCSEYLPGDNCSVELVYNKGKLMAYFMKKRLTYSMKETDIQQGGSSVVSECIDDLELLKLAQKAIVLVSKDPNGVYGIDFKGNNENEPKITEINAGRFLTASHVYYYKLGYNLPKLLVELALGLPVTKLGEYPLGKKVYRQIDKEPVCI